MLEPRSSGSVGPKAPFAIRFGRDPTGRANDTRARYQAAPVVGMGEIVGGNQREERLDVLDVSGANDGDVVGVEYRIGGDEGHAFDLCLGDEKAVERVTMMRRE